MYSVESGWARNLGPEWGLRICDCLVYLLVRTRMKRFWFVVELVIVLCCTDCTGHRLLSSFFGLSKFFLSTDRPLNSRRYLKDCLCACIYSVGNSPTLAQQY